MSLMLCGDEVMKHILKLTLIPLAVLVLINGVVHAVTQTMTANMRFLEPLTIVSVTDPDMGDFLATATTNDTYNMDTLGAVTGTGSTDYIGGNVVGSLTVVGSTVGTIDIIANNFVSNGGIDVISVPCNYGAAGEVSCSTGITNQAAPGAGTVLLIGANLQATTAHVDGDLAAPTYDIVVTYN